MDVSGNGANAIQITISLRLQTDHGLLYNGEGDCEITLVSFCWLHPTVSSTLTLTQCNTVNSVSRTKSVRRTKRVCEMSLLSFGFCRKKRGAEDVPGGDAQDDTINKRVIRRSVTATGPL